MIRLAAVVSQAVEGATVRYSLDAIALNHALGLPPLSRRPVCHGFACVCVCVECLDREKRGLKAPPAPRQPWELAA